MMAIRMMAVMDIVSPVAGGSSMFGEAVLQRAPSQPVRQMHTADCPLSVQEAPLRQGLTLRLQGPRFSHLLPVYPGRQEQDRLFADDIQVPPF